jgi:hypothetical protein
MRFEEITTSLRSSQKHAVSFLKEKRSALWIYPQ